MCLFFHIQKVKDDTREREKWREREREKDSIVFFQLVALETGEVSIGGATNFTAAGGYKEVGGVV